MMEQQDESKRSGRIFQVVAMIVLPLLYVLSTGPVFWLRHHGPPKGMSVPIDYFVAVVYAPLRILYDYSSTFAMWYVPLWDPGSRTVTSGTEE